MRRGHQSQVSELVIGAVVLTAVAACSKPSSPGSCFRPHENICLNYEAPQAEAGRRLCTGLQWSAAPCASDNRIGTCTKGDVVEQYYRGSPNNYDATTAKLACEHASGVWH
jgi:hypothetical protein